MTVTVDQIVTVNPATEEVIAHHPVMPEAEVDAVLEAVHGAFPAWRDLPMRRRSELMHEAAAVLRRRRDELAALITIEMGKVSGEARAEVEKCATTCDHYAEHAEDYLADLEAPSDASRSFVAFEPLGTVLAVMPWNFPFWQVIRFAAPALMAGNTGVLKHASNTTGSALAIESVFREAGFAEPVFRTLVLPGRRVEALIEDARIAAVTLTGSDATGSQVAAAAGRCLKKTVLELGGSDAFVVLDDADLEAAAATAARSRFQNCGQSCIAAKRFIVVETVADSFEEALVAEAERFRTGDPTEPSSTMGPLARADLREELEGQLRDSVQRGARVLSGGRRLDRRGWFFQPTVLAGCAPGMPAFDEETFGPLAAVSRVSGEDEARRLANHSAFGLGGNVWTRDVERGVRFARSLETGGVFVNGMTHSDPRLPFGGVKRSGYGRELHSFGIREFVNVKTIWVG
ncbi:MAG TPA: NAD-dependent succinate-semialdehyde dehydrogenase [Candidatus Binatia bacterium]|nr:NAD-dependent succinate-semialdehyde dehydrogenase [Candidatus Binatia bacterium]